MSFLEGLVTGFAMILFIGPVLFTLLEASLSYGFKGGLTVAIGIIVSDIVAIGICSLGAIPFFENNGNQYWIAIGGSILLLAMGLAYIFKPKKMDLSTIEIGAKDAGSLFTRGFLVNFVNPFVFLVWIGLIGRGHDNYPDHLWIYLVGVLLGIFSIDVLKAYYAGKLRAFLSHKRLKVIYRVLGIVLIIFAGRLFFYALGMD